jgi:hypothetical protein
MGRRTKVDLHFVLELVDELQPSYSELVDAISNHERCSKRTAQDAITILRRAGYVKTERAPRNGPGQYGARRTLYRPSARGQTVLGHPMGRLVLHGARRLFTANPSAKARRRQIAIAADPGLDRALRRIEAAYLVPPEKLYRPIPSMPDFVTTLNVRLI